MTTIEKIKKMTIRPGIHGMVSSFGVSMLAGDKKNFRYGDTDIPVWQLGFGLGAGSSVAVEVASNFILPHIHGSAKMQHLESLVLHLGGSGFAFVGAAKLMNGNLNMEEAKKFFVTGLISEALSQYIYNNFIDEPVF